MSNKLIGFHLSEKAIRNLKYYCFCTGFSMSYVIENLINSNIHAYVGGDVGTPEENTSESE